MKKIFLILLLFSAIHSKAQQAENIIIITTDGFRWQEAFKGMDENLARDKKFNQNDSSYIYKKYWAENPKERREKLMPFMWSVLAKKGQLYGNRTLGNKVNNANPYWFSYPGYNEIMTGYADTLINSNKYPANPNVTVLEYLNKQPKIKGKVAAFGAWDAFDNILNEKRGGFPVISAFDKTGGKNPTAKQQLINAMLADSFKPFHEEECLDVFTHYGALEELKTNKPRVLYISYGETDEWAHAGFYRSYLDAAHQVDAWMKEIWNFVQNDPQYKNKTALIFTTDHGRGDLTKAEWTSHGPDIKDASEIWFAAMGPQIEGKGEMTNENQLYQNQFAQTIAKIMGYTYEAKHPISKEIPGVIK
ncbi:phosphoglyceromutase [Flavobacterium sp. P4023]|uniref:Phosphoglyceromutase n=1 Tax=Flavobacterium flabelliforme TaxID=2816119 RepID=A0ABS5CPW8_9FLAO|nr:alkaline phosphatase family protein [Flavobacterium flabelliforme]MBP4140671.1 phosphoglyceromutase [Flavobacterium flabelliforme]